ncbi:molybdate ABC transporter substrate-binding protein [Mastigocoleus testarum BC008]|uniref:Molybdate ABC transporter substrate-binding protein n=1 Tax=Mastigocoleus testarum BC008 TaxID=371196 RepID=A0A0V7ZK24_9CYAN|nr:molybdate ABC transporter substrate-binding protein [Mastigocoleus testarum BC008]KST64802.1 molybdate ABC transporter substrate-binding protein [Mastigocoleus testarum BC008]
MEVKPKILVLILSSLLIACNQTNQNSTSRANTQQTASLTVSAAASLTDALPSIKKMYEQQNPQVSITYNFASSGNLQRQIEQGAPADVFISASVNKMDILQKQGLLSQGSRKDLLQNKVVLIVSKDNSTISDFKDLTATEVNKISIGEPNSVPAGKYAKEVLTNAGIFEDVKSKTVFAKTVRQVLTYVETGNVDAGIVYATDAKSSNRVKVAAIAPVKSHSPVVYPVAVIKDSNNSTAAKEFVEFLSSKPASEVFAKNGFTPVINNSPINNSQNN